MSCSIVCAGDKSNPSELQPRFGQRESGTLEKDSSTKEADDETEVVQEIKVLLHQGENTVYVEIFADILVCEILKKVIRKFRSFHFHEYVACLALRPDINKSVWFYFRKGRVICKMWENQSSRQVSLHNVNWTDTSALCNTRIDIGTHNQCSITLNHINGS